MERFDIAVIGSGPAGQKAAIQGAKAGKRVVLVERGKKLGGGCVHYGTIPSKTLREAAVQISRLRQLLGDVAPIGSEFAISQLLARLDSVLSDHASFWKDQLERNGVAMRQGHARFVGPTRLEVESDEGLRTIHFETAIIATGSRPRQPENITIDHKFILDSDSILSIDAIPRSLVVLGGGVIACEYASIFASLGASVTIIDGRDRPLAFLDSELSEHFLAAFRRMGGRYLPGQNVQSLRCTGSVVIAGEGAGALVAQRALVALGRTPNTGSLGLDTVGIEPGPRGTIAVDENGHTGVASIYAVGDVVGAPSLASTAMDQGRRAVRAAVQLPTHHAPDLIPSGIYTIPEISCVGMRTDQVPGAVVGIARYAEVARGLICGDQDGVLRLVCSPGDLRIVGVHIIGEGATELVHIAQAGMLAGWTAHELVDNVFNFPTFAEAYRIAGLDAIKRARGMVHSRRRRATGGL